MKPSRGRTWSRQLELFEGPRKRMTWGLVPADVQAEIRRLLVRMLESHVNRRSKKESDSEVRHER